MQMATDADRALATSPETMESKVQGVAGIYGLRVWQFVNATEPNKKFGYHGRIQGTPEEIASATGIPLKSVITVLVRLVQAQLLRYCPNGTVSPL